MPEVIVHAVAGRSAAQKKALCADITDAVVKHFNAPIEAVTVTIIEAPKDTKMKGGVMFSER
jgi:4-oxalocrotonate tautomerase